jgi:hypothetical protein
MRLVVAALSLIAAAACGDDGATNHPDGGPPAEIFDSRVEIIEISDNVGGASNTSVYAVFYDGPVPSSERELNAAGDCRLLEEERPFCTDPCDGVCVATNTCEPLPVRITGGQLSIAAGQFSIGIDPGADNVYGEWLDGAPVRGEATISLEGGPAPALDMNATMPPALVMPDLDADYEIPETGDWTLEWTPGGDAAARVRLEVHNDLHGGGLNSRIVCDAADSGTLVVDAALLDHARFRVNGACGECPLQMFRRYRTPAVSVDGVSVELGSQLGLEWYSRPGQQ